MKELFCQGFQVALRSLFLDHVSMNTFFTLVVLFSENSTKVPFLKGYLIPKIKPQEWDQFLKCWRSFPEGIKIQKKPLDDEFSLH
jgi:hypothetical protein